MGDCVVPEEITICILTRLPVKSIIRFKSVCKQWRHLLSTRDFMKMHALQFSSDPKNQSLVVHQINKYYGNTISLFNIESNQKKPTTLYHPYARKSVRIEIVGCCNGLICISDFKAQMFVLWNPALKLGKDVWPKFENFGFGKTVSLGFGYDAVGADFKVVRIECWEDVGEVKVDVYSVYGDSWMTIDVGFQFSVGWRTIDVIVNGNPCWWAKLDENQKNNVLLCFDVTKLVFKTVPMCTLFYEWDDEVRFVDWNGSLGAFVCTMGKIQEKIHHVWVFDEGEQSWRKNHTYGPIKLYVDRFSLCLKNGRILGERPNGGLMIIYSESENKFGEKITNLSDVNAAREQSFEVYAYCESLAYIEGMEKVDSRKRMRQ